LRMREQGYTFKETAKVVGVHERTVAKWADVAARMGLQTAIDGVNGHLL
jgi:transposase